MSEATAQQQAKSEARFDGAVVKTGPLAGGVGLGVLLMTLLENRPEVLAQVMAWGPGLVVIGGMLLLAHRWAGPLISSQIEAAATQREMGANLARLAQAVEGGMLEQRREIGILLQVMSSDIGELKSMKRDIAEIRSAMDAHGFLRPAQTAEGAR